MRIITLSALLLVPLLAVAADALIGRVVKIADGDTLTLLTPEKEQVRVRLAEIDAPERGQPWGSKAKDALIDQVAGKEVTVEVVTTDRYGRTVGIVLYRGTNLNLPMDKSRGF